MASASIDRDDVTKAFGARLRKLRTEADLSTRALGEAVHLSAARISEIENGKFAEAPDLDLVWKWVHACASEAKRAGRTLSLNVDKEHWRHEHEGLTRDLDRIRQRSKGRRVPSSTHEVESQPVEESNPSHVEVHRAITGLRPGGPRRALTIFAGGLLASGLGWWIWEATQAQPDNLNDASLPLTVAATGLVLLALGQMSLKPRREAPIMLEAWVDRLGEVVRTQWTRAALERRLLEPAPLPIHWCRSALPVAPPVDAAIGSPRVPARFAPLPGLTAVAEDRLRTGGRTELHAVYGGLGSGRLLIVGPPGAGKSAAAILLLLDAIRCRDHATPSDRLRIPVPVMFTLHGWNPHTKPVAKWIVEQLAQTYPIFAGRDGVRCATAMLEAGRIAVFLDGLDEIAEQLRPMALRALSEQATFRLVILTRDDELIAATGEARLAGAVALDIQPVATTDAAAYLLRQIVDPAPDSWRQMTQTLLSSTAVPLHQALDRPLALTLIRDTYNQSDNVAELLDTTRFPTATDVENHLLDRSLTAAYATRPGQPAPRYDLYTAHHTLSYLARRMNQAGTRDLAWWYWQQWIPRIYHILLMALPIAATFEIVVTVNFSSSHSMSRGSRIPIEILMGLILSTISVLAAPQQNLLHAQRIQWRSMFSRNSPTTKITRRLRGLFLGVTIGHVFAVIAVVKSDTLQPITVPTVLAIIISGTIIGASGWLITFIVGRFMRTLFSGLGIDLPTVDYTNPNTPRTSWRHDAIGWFYIGLAGGTILGTLAGLIILAGRASLSALEFAGFVMGAAVLIGIISFCGASRAGPASFAQVYLALTQRTPLRLLRFLEDAKERHVLRAVGQVYQFRHARLQDRLAATHSGSIAENSSSEDQPKKSLGHELRTDGTPNHPRRE